jgi:diamine N-acetyltransferase
MEEEERVPWSLKPPRALRSKVDDIRPIQGSKKTPNDPPSLLPSPRLRQSRKLRRASQPQTTNNKLQTPNLMSAVHVRIATKDDAALIADLSRTTFFETFAEQNTRENMDKFMNEQFTRDKLMNEVGADNNIFLIAEIDGEVAGYARMREVPNPEALDSLPAIELARIYSVQSRIGKGVGSALMKKCIEVAQQQNKKVLWLGVWEKNQHAIAFYERWGFEKFSEHDFVLGDDVQRDWLMKKTL